ncbi:Ni/Co efflux regulator RcnB [Brevundimonas alba]|uniref:Ni/Co efflux regulator RcnB n=1 Tax=Brevundimonas alba TaxID=74314 RepID=A0A7X5YNW2_9CAUL|nr:RcnB family protein [Brevundimonas alba]NJC42144.1 Ni/Co efflux regulator RcnB [Brevundimonas alba]
MLKPLMIGALSLATLAAPMAASAQDWRRDHDRDGRYERWERRADRNDRRDYRRWERQERREYRRWARGQVIPSNYRRSWYINDYRRYGYRTPPRGYGYYRTDTGDIVLAAIATGVILSLLD